MFDGNEQIDNVMFSVFIAWRWFVPCFKSKLLGKFHLFKDLAILIGSLYVRYSGQSESLAQLKDESSSLPTVLQQLQDLTNQIG